MALFISSKLLKITLWYAHHPKKQQKNLGLYKGTENPLFLKETLINALVSLLIYAVGARTGLCLFGISQAALFFLEGGEGYGRKSR
jgi:hypothetical protein